MSGGRDQDCHAGRANSCRYDSLHHGARHSPVGDIVNRLLSVVRSMIDKIIEVSRAVVAGGRYGESNAPASWIRTPE